MAKGLPPIQRLGYNVGQGPAQIFQWPQLNRAAEREWQENQQKRKEAAAAAAREEYQLRDQVFELSKQIGNEKSPYWESHPGYASEIEAERDSLYSDLIDSVDDISSGNYAKLLEFRKRTNKFAAKAAASVKDRDFMKSALETLAQNPKLYSDERKNLIMSVSNGQMTVAEARAIDPNFHWMDQVDLDKLEQDYYKAHENLMDKKLRDPESTGFSGLATQVAEHDPQRYAEQFTNDMLRDFTVAKTFESQMVKDGFQGNIEDYIYNFAYNRRYSEEEKAVRYNTPRPPSDGDGGMVPPEDHESMAAEISKAVAMTAATGDDSYVNTAIANYTGTVSTVAGDGSLTIGKVGATAKGEKTVAQGSASVRFDDPGAIYNNILQSVGIDPEKYPMEKYVVDRPKAVSKAVRLGRAPWSEDVIKELTDLEGVTYKEPSWDKYGYLTIDGTRFDLQKSSDRAAAAALLDKKYKVEARREGDPPPGPTKEEIENLFPTP